MNTFEFRPIPFGQEVVQKEYKVCTLIENKDGSRTIVYSEEKIEETKEMKKWWHEKITTEKIQEIQSVQEGMVDRIQNILKTL